MNKNNFIHKFAIYLNIRVYRYITVYRNREIAMATHGLLVQSAGLAF